MVTRYYFDTCAIKSLKQGKEDRELSILFEASKRGIIGFFVSDIVIYEMAKKGYQGKERNVFSFTIDPVEEFYRFYYATYKKFQNSGAQIIQTTGAHISAAKKYVESGCHYFQICDDGKNDFRDAIIYAAALECFPDLNVCIVSKDENLRAEFKKLNYKTDAIADVKSWIEGLSAQMGEVSIPKQVPFGDILEINPNLLFVVSQHDSEFGKLLENAQNSKEMRCRVSGAALADPNNLIILDSDAVNGVIIPVDQSFLIEELTGLGADDKNIREKLLAYTQALAPIPIKRLRELLDDPRDHVLSANIDRLLGEKIIVNVGDLIIPNTESRKATRLCEAAFNARISDIMSLLESGK